MRRALGATYKRPVPDRFSVGHLHNLKRGSLLIGCIVQRPFSSVVFRRSAHSSGLAPRVHIITGQRKVRKERGEKEQVAYRDSYAEFCFSFVALVVGVRRSASAWAVMEVVVIEGTGGDRSVEKRRAPLDLGGGGVGARS